MENEVVAILKLYDIESFYNDGYIKIPYEVLNDVAISTISMELTKVTGTYWVTERKDDFVVLHEFDD